MVSSLSGQSDSIHHETDSLRNQFSLEIFGSGVNYSIGYERIIINHPRFNLASRIGMGYYPFNDEMFSIPLELTTFWGSNNNNVETGMGLVWCSYRPTIPYGITPAASEDLNFSDTKETQLLYSFRFGYRYQKPYHRSSFRIALTFLFESSDGVLKIYYQQIPIGISYGYRF